MTNLNDIIDAEFTAQDVGGQDELEQYEDAIADLTGA